VRGWLLPYGPWYALTAWGAFITASAAVAGDILTPVWCGLVVAVVGAVAIRSQVRWSKSGEKALRAEMIRLVDARARSGAAGWLNRDAHLVFSVNRKRIAGLRGRMLVVIDEEQLRDIEDARVADGGKVALTAVSYQVHPAHSRVVRRADGSAALVTADSLEDVGPDNRERWWQGYPGMIRTMRAGLMFADAGELARVLEQFRSAEPVSPDSLT
jgi:hypothetical protein